MKNIFSLILIAIYSLGFFCNTSFAQVDFTEFEEKFTTASKPNNWEWDPASPVKSWEFKDGSTDDSHPPLNAYEGDYNAVFLRADNSTTKTKLVTPPISFEFGIKPVLQFYHAQYHYEDEFGFGNTRLSLYYRSPEVNNNNWVLLKTYSEAVNEWTLQEYLFPDSVRYSSVQLAFEGWSSKIFEHGTCIDDIKIIETGIIPKFIKSVSAIQASQDIVPTGSNNNPIIRLKFSVNGNDGELFLDSLGINALFDSENVVSANGIKLFSTVSEKFNDTIPVGTASSFENGIAIFDNIQFDLPIGNSYIWVTYDIPIDVNHEFKGKVLDASIDANGIKINNEYYASTEIDPAGIRLVSESLFFDDFEGEKLWDTTGEFQIGKPLGLSGIRPEPDPSYAQSGKNVLGSDLSGLNDNPGYYENNISSSNKDIATADTVINAKYYKDLQLGFYRWLNLYVNDSASIEISKNGGLTWNTIWNNTQAHIESSWSFKQIGLSHIADREENLKFRFTLGPTQSSPHSGWNIDNVGLTGTFIDDDAGFLSLVSPSEGCGHIVPEPVEIIIQNFGYSATNDTLPVGYSIDGGNTFVMDTLFESIPRDGTKNFTFNELIDLTTPGYHNIIVKTFYELDEDNRNDKLDTTLFIPPTYTPPYAQSFENGNDFWRSFGTNETWKLGQPTDTIITDAYEGKNCWVTNLSGHYPDLDTAWIESPCFNFSNVDKPIFECMLWADAEIDNDGLALYYSINEGASWEFVPTETIHAFDWDWYNNSTISALGSEGFDSVKNGWFKTRQILPATLAGEPVVKFKLLFISNDTITDAGFAIDNIKIYDAPIDAGITALITPADACVLSDEQTVTVQIKNFGIRAIKTTDSIIANVDINGLTLLSEVFYLTDTILVNETKNFTFSNTVNLFDKDDYEFVVYTSLESDTSYYIPNTHNDTLTDIINITGEPYYSLGPDIGTLVPENETLDAEGFYTDGTFNSYAWKNHYDNATGSNQTYPVPVFPGGVDEMYFSIIVENDQGCISYDTIKVTRSISDLGITSAIGTIDTCINKQATQYLEIVLQNFSADTTYSAGDTLQAGYEFEGSEPYIETFTLTASMAAGENETFQFDSVPHFPDSGSYSLKVYSVIYADLDYSNDTTTIPVTIFPYPEVSIGEDSIFTLDALTDIVSFDASNDYFGIYKWQDNSSLPTFTLTTDETFEYTIEVADTNSCGIAYDTVMVIADNWIVDSLISPVSACSLTNAEQFSFVLINESPNTYPIGYEIIAEITVNGNYYKDTVLLSTPLNPNDSIDYLFNTNFDLSTPGQYLTSIRILPEFDMNLNDNSLSETVEVWGIFPIDLGADTVITQRADTILLEAGNGYASYLWTVIDEEGSETVLSTMSQMQIPQTNSFTYKGYVTSEHGCSNSSDSVKIMAHDIGVTEIIKPESDCNLTSTDKIRITLHNFGPDEIPTNESINFYYRINNGGWIEKPHTTIVPIPPGESSNLIIFENITFESTETYNMELYAKWNKDNYHHNDTAIKFIYEYPSESVDLGPDIITGQPDTVIIDGGAGHTTYTWQDGLGSQFFNVTNNYSDTYSVTVTNAFGCYDSDTIQILSNDLFVETNLGDENTCTVGNRDIAISIEIMGQDSIFPGTFMDVYYKLNSLDSIRETVNIDDTITSTEPFVYTFSTQLNISDTGNYSLATAILPDLDTDITNNTTTSEFRVGAYPVDLGEDIITYAESVVLDAGAGFSEYLWGNASTEQTQTVSISNTYSVTITDDNGCNASDEIKVLFLKPGYDITEVIGLADSCINLTNDQISFTLYNSGNDTVFTDSIIPIAYRINDTIVNNENYTFTDNFIPGESLNISFNNKANLSIIATYNIQVSATFGSKTSTKDTVINTWGLPEVNLGDDFKSVEESVILDAGAGFTNYLWSTNDTTQTTEVSTSGIYSVTVTSEHGCKNSDDVKVTFVSTALEIMEFIGPNEGCSPLNTEKATIKIRNYGGRVVPAGTNIGLGYVISGQARVSESVEISNMQPQATYTHEFDEFLFTPETGIVDIQFYIKVENIDVDTADYTITVNESPQFSFDSDTIQVTGYPYTLDPDITAESYLWNTGATSPTIVVNSNGPYILEISNLDNCSTSDTVYIENINSVFNEWGSKINIYPNPAEHKLFIDLPEVTANTVIEFVDSKGKVLIHNKEVVKENEFDISLWSQGIYFVRVFDDVNYAIFKVVIQ